MPPEYDEDEDIDYTLHDEDSANMILDDMEQSREPTNSAHI